MKLTPIFLSRNGIASLFVCRSTKNDTREHIFCKLLLCWKMRRFYLFCIHLKFLFPFCSLFFIGPCKARSHGTPKMFTQQNTTKLCERKIWLMLYFLVLKRIYNHCTDSKIPPRIIKSESRLQGKMSYKTQITK